MAEIKHVGRLKSNHRKVVVAYRVIPGDKEAKHALVVDTASLADADHDTLISTVEGNPAQNAFEFAEVMARTKLGDGANMLARFHTSGKLTKVPHSEIEMTPNNQTVLGLDELNQIIADQKGVTIAELALKDPNDLGKDTTVQEAGSVYETPAPKSGADVLAEAQAADIPLQASSNEVLTDDQLAASYRSQADRLYKEAKALRAQAEELVPTTKKSKSSAKTTAS